MTINAGDLAIWRVRWKRDWRHVPVEVLGHTAKRVKVLVRLDGIPTVRYLRTERLERAGGGCSMSVIEK